MSLCTSAVLLLDCKLLEDSVCVSCGDQHCAGHKAGAEQALSMLSLVMRGAGKGKAGGGDQGSGRHPHTRGALGPGSGSVVLELQNRLEGKTEHKNTSKRHSAGH